MKSHIKIRHSIILSLFIMLFICLFCLKLTAFEAECYDFANFTEADSVAFVEECGIRIPENILLSGQAASFTHSLVMQAYSHPNVRFCFNYYETQDYAEAIRMAVCSHMDFITYTATASESTYQLQFNTVQAADGSWQTSGGKWNSKWKDYNCYAYAINRAEHPAFYSNEKQYRPGVMCGKEPWYHYATTVQKLSELVIEDLVAMGYDYDSIHWHTSIPEIEDHQELFCVRLLNNTCSDYHFMRYDPVTNAWYHKPIDTAILKFNSVPSNSEKWYIEYSERGSEWQMPDADGDGENYYSGDIIYITYNKNQINVGSTEATSSVSIQPGKDVFCELNFATSGFYDIQLTSTYPFVFDIYSEDFRDEDDDENGNVYVYGEDNDNSLFSNSNSGNFNQSIWFEAGKYYLRMNFISDSLDAPCNIDVSIEHQHSYGIFVSINKFSHRRNCACGATQVSSHYISGTHVGEDWVPCAGCGYLLDMRNDIHEGIMSITKVSVNGSYIRSDGIVVLVDEDIEAYLAGTLQFYHPEDVPVTQ